MSDQSNENEGIGAPRFDGPPAEDFSAPGRSVFGDDVSFDDDDDAIPHWSEPATGAVPQVGAGAGIAFEPSSGPEVSAPPAGGDTWAADPGSPRWANDPVDHVIEDSPADSSFDAESDAAAGFFEFDETSTPSQPLRVGRVEAVPDLSGETDLSQLAPLVGAGSDRDMTSAVVVGVGLAVVFLLAMAVGPALALAVVVVALTLAAVEFFTAVRVAGNHPAVLLGLTTVLMMPLAVYWRGEAALVLVTILAIVFGSLWYVTGVGAEGMLRGLATTILGVVYIGVLGSFAALMLSVDTYGTGLLTTAIILTVAYDTGGLVFGKLIGRTPLSPASPNKTIEGLMGGMGCTIGVALLLGIMGQPAPIAGNVFAGSGFSSMFVIGLVVALIAPIGDLAESQLKRDLKIKDMGTILPGHGGLLDRFDSMLFVLPTVWYAANALVLN